MWSRVLARLGLLLAGSLLAVSPGAAAEKLVMGVHPFKPAVELHRTFKPIADALAARLGRPVELQIGRSYEDTAQRLGSGRFDLSYLGPTTYAKYGPRLKLRPLAQVVNAGSATFQGVIVVKKGSPIRSLKDLKGRRFAFGDRDSTLTHVVPVYMLVEAGVRLTDLGKVAFLGTHDNLALNVLAGTVDAAGLMPDIAAKYSGLQVIATSPALPEHLFAAKPSMDPATFAALQEALLDLDPSLRKGIKGSLTGMRKVDDKDFEILRRILEVAEREPER
jgi:phosphonate transport system substrate-binding protein